MAEARVRPMSDTRALPAFPGVTRVWVEADA